MQEAALINEPAESTPEQEGCHYHSVEFSMEGLKFPYQLKIWDITPTSVCLLIKEDSALLQWLKVGQTLSAKYYYNNPAYLYDHLDTVVQRITKGDKGRFKGHYVVDLEILKNEDLRGADQVPFPEPQQQEVNSSA